MPAAEDRTHPLPHDSFAVLLDRWLPAQRWFAGKRRAVQAISVVADTSFAGDAAGTGDLRAPPEAVSMRHLVIAVDYDDGGVEFYQLLVGLRQELPQRLEHAAIGQLPQSDGQTFAVYDAVHDGELTSLLLQLFAEAATVGLVRFVRMDDAEVDTSLSSRVISGEQTNTSLVYGEEHILKLFRRLTPGINPDVEVHRALGEIGGRYVAPLLGWLDTDLEDSATTLGMLQQFLPSGTEGWALATASVRDLFAEADLHADEVGGDFAGEAERLGAATAAVHADLARVLPSGAAGPAESQATARQLHDRLDAARGVVPDLDAFATALHAAYDEVARISEAVPVQRIHGDYHLGQVLRTQNGWVLLDFEGEPARPLAERTALMSPLRDVAGMLRSFDYAARHLLADHPHERGLAYRANEWADRNRNAFCDGYAQGSGTDPRAHEVLLRAFELDKAVYEVIYEARHRPTWLPIPLGSIERLVG